MNKENALLVVGASNIVMINEDIVKKKSDIDVIATFFESKY